jgi:hypothetical protein
MKKSSCVRFRNGPGQGTPDEWTGVGCQPTSKDLVLVYRLGRWGQGLVPWGGRASSGSILSDLASPSSLESQVTPDIVGSS